jgi:hypothetical protein
VGPHSVETDISRAEIHGCWRSPSDFAKYMFIFHSTWSLIVGAQSESEHLVRVLGRAYPIWGIKLGAIEVVLAAYLLWQWLRVCDNNLLCWRIFPAIYVIFKYAFAAGQVDVKIRIVRVLNNLWLFEWSHRIDLVVSWHLSLSNT